MCQQRPRCFRQYSRCTTIALALLLFEVVAGAATAVVECTADRALDGKGDAHATELPAGGALLTFRFEAIRDWKVNKGDLFLHLEKGSVPARLELALVQAPWNERDALKMDVRKLNFLPQPVEGQPERWIRLAIPASILEMLAAGKGTGLAIRDRTSAGKDRVLHARESMHNGAYLIVDGAPPQR